MKNYCSCCPDVLTQGEIARIFQIIDRIGFAEALDCYHARTRCKHCGKAGGTLIRKRQTLGINRYCLQCGNPDGVIIDDN